MLRGARWCGENSLPIYCLGVLLALVSQFDLFNISNRPAMQIALSLGGVLMMTAVAALLNALSTKRKPAVGAADRKMPAAVTNRKVEDRTRGTALDAPLRAVTAPSTYCP